MDNILFINMGILSRSMTNSFLIMCNTLGKKLRVNIIDVRTRYARCVPTYPGQVVYTLILYVLTNILTYSH